MGYGFPARLAPVLRLRHVALAIDASTYPGLCSFVASGCVRLKTLGTTMNDEPTPGPQIEGVVIPQDKAEQVAATIFGAIRGDIAGLHAEMAAIRSATTGIQGELVLLANKADVQKLRTDVQARIERVERRLLMGFGVLAGVLIALVIAALRYLPAVGHS
jgi:hypothetical protein